MINNKLQNLMHFISKVKPVNSIWLFRIASFLSAFLLFQIQPMISKALLPSFGGSYLVWASSMMFFQGALLLGYFYVHTLQKYLGISGYARRHWILILLPLAMLPFRFEKLLEFEHPSFIPLFIVVPILLLTNCGIPFFSLSTASLILQSWLSISNISQKDNPYVLYASSNLGSLLGLLTYPFIFEPLFNLKEQAFIWWAAYIILIALYLTCKPRYDDKKPHSDSCVNTKNINYTFQWFVLSLSGCFSLIAVTNMITTDIASVPFVWVMPLAVYLLTFILVFKHNLWCPHGIKKMFTWSIAIGILLYMTVPVHPIPLILLHLGILFVICLNCHAALIHIKPAQGDNLTNFYLTIALGGWTGSLIVSTVMPLVSSSLIEYPLSLFLASLAIAITTDFKKKTAADFLLAAVMILLVITTLTILPWVLTKLFHITPQMIFVVIAFPIFFLILNTTENKFLTAVVILVITIFSPWMESIASGRKNVWKMRNFYGVYTVYDIGNQRYLRHGTTIHGRQYLNTSKRNIPLSYHHPTAPAGEILWLNPFNYRDIAIVGLGAGALSVYAGSGQTVTIYELDPDNLPIAEKFFTYLSFSRQRGAKQRLVFGDGRISLRKEKAASYDLLILDAFNSGSIPVHLLTIEAFREYFRVLRPDGLILINISNNMLNLSPVLYTVAFKGDFYACGKRNTAPHHDADFSSWIAFSQKKEVYETLVKYFGWEHPQNNRINRRAWSDQYANLLDAIRIKFLTWTSRD